jgi:hypothetical protein
MRFCEECKRPVVNQDWRRDYDYCSLNCARAALPKREKEADEALQQFQAWEFAAEHNGGEGRRFLESSRLQLSRATVRRNCAQLELQMYDGGPSPRP